MHKKLVISTLGKILYLESFFMLFPLVVAFYYKEPLQNILAFILVINLSLVVGMIFSRQSHTDTCFGIKDGFAIVSLSWILLSIFGSLPFVISGEIPHIIDAIFETASGFTTTGASILTDVEKLSKSMLFWRSFTHFIGGMGILVFALAVIPKNIRGSVHVMKAEVPGPTFGKLVSKTDITAKILYKIYICMTIALILILKLAGMDWFDAFIHAFGTAGTGGFSNKALSVGYYNNTLIYNILSVGMILFGINFNLYYFILIGKVKDAIKSEELKTYLLIIGVSFLLICVNLYSLYDNIGIMMRDVFFNISSIISTTGFGVSDFDKWPLFSKNILLLLMFIGSCAGSTAGGLKILRVNLLIKSAIRSLKSSLNPKRILMISEDGHSVPGNIIENAHMYFMLYVIVFVVGVASLSIWENDFMTAFSSVAATLNNIGPGFAKVGPMGNFAFYNDFSKLMLTLIMIVGRLEIFPVLVLFMPNTWRKK